MFAGRGANPSACFSIVEILQSGGGRAIRQHRVPGLVFWVTDSSRLWKGQGFDFLPGKRRPSGPRKPRGIGRPQLRPRLKGPATRHPCNQPSPTEDFNFLACSKICRIPAGATRRNRSWKDSSARRAESFSATQMLISWFRDIRSDFANLNAAAFNEGCRRKE